MINRSPPTIRITTIGRASDIAPHSSRYQVHQPCQKIIPNPVKCSHTSLRDPVAVERPCPIFSNSQHVFLPSNATTNSLLGSQKIHFGLQTPRGERKKYCFSERRISPEKRDSQKQVHNSDLKEIVSSFNKMSIQSIQKKDKQAVKAEKIKKKVKRNKIYWQFQGNYMPSYKYLSLRGTQQIFSLIEKPLVQYGKCSQVLKSTTITAKGDQKSASTFNTNLSSHCQSNPKLSRMGLGSSLLPASEGKIVQNSNYNFGGILQSSNNLSLNEYFSTKEGLQVKEVKDSTILLGTSENFNLLTSDPQTPCRIAQSRLVSLPEIQEFPISESNLLSPERAYSPQQKSGERPLIKGLLGDSRQMLKESIYCGEQEEVEKVEEPINLQLLGSMGRNIGKSVIRKSGMPNNRSFVI